MKKSAVLLLLLLLLPLLVLACSKKPVPPPQAEAAPPPVASKPAAITGPVDAGPPPDPPDRSATRADREKAVLAFIRSGRASDLPEQSLEPRSPWESDLALVLSPPFKPSKVEQASVKIEGGGLEESTVSRILGDWHGHLARCYEIERELRPDLTGVVTLNLELDPRGNVKNVTGNSAMSDAAALVKCCVNSVKPLSFGQPVGGALVKITYGIKFAPPPK